MHSDDGIIHLHCVVIVLQVLRAVLTLGQTTFPIADRSGGVGRENTTVFVTSPHTLVGAGAECDVWGGPGQEVGCRRGQGGGRCWLCRGGCFLAGGLWFCGWDPHAQSFHPRDEAMLGLCPPRSRPGHGLRSNFLRLCPSMGKNPLRGSFWAGRLFLCSPQPRGLCGSKASAFPTADLIPWLATLGFAKCDRTQWFVKLHLLQSWDATRFWGLFPSRKRLQAKIRRARPPPPEHTFWRVGAKNKKL